MKKVILTIITLLLTLTPTVFANEPSTNENLVASETVDVEPSYGDWYETTSQYKGRDRRIDEDHQRYTGRPRSTIYQDLCPQDTELGKIYGFLRPVKPVPKEPEEEGQTKTARSPGWMEVTNKEQLTHKRLTGWLGKTKAGIECECKECECEECICPPFVCKSNMCEKNYLVLCSAKWCKYCPKMYGVVKQLREEGYSVYFIDVDEYPAFIQTHRVTSFPCAIVRHHRQEMIRFNGVTPIEKIRPHLIPLKDQKDD